MGRNDISKFVRILLPVVLAILFLGIESTVASPIVITTVSGDTTLATGITGLVIDGVVYDLEFRHSSVQSLYGTSPGNITFHSSSEAYTAVLAMDAVLNAVTAQSDWFLADAVTKNGWDTWFLVPYFVGSSSSDLYSSTFYLQPPDAVKDWHPMQVTGFPNDVASMFTVFTAVGSTAVPEPGSLFLICAGLTSIGLAELRKKK
jgi:hypothetical protein